MSDPTTGRLGLLPARRGVAHDSAADERLKCAAVAEIAFIAPTYGGYGGVRMRVTADRSRWKVRWVALDSAGAECVNGRFGGLPFDAGRTAVRRAPVAVAVHRGDPALRRLTVWSPFPCTHASRV